MTSLLLVEDDAAFRKIYGKLLRDAGYDVAEADDRPSASAAFQDRDFSVVVLDLMLPPDGTVAAGLDQLAELVRTKPQSKIVVASGAGDLESMVAAVKRGAFDFLTKPVDPDVLLIVVARAVERVRLEAKIASLEDRLLMAHPESTMIGEADSFLRAVELAERVAKSDLPVLITGENGTGKELLARRIHDSSPRASKPFVPVNCGAIPETLLESTFFGHVKGAFTGAVKDQPGLFRQADGGSLFLDELGDMPLPLQVKVLRAVEYGEILPVGGQMPVQVDVRVISATNQDLKKKVSDGSFREDLYWRIKGAEVELPPLSDRMTDLPLLSKHFLNRAASLSPDGAARILSDEAVEAMMRHRWPGNLRELRHEMQRATVMAGARAQIEPEDLSFATEHQSDPVPRVGSLHDKVAELEKAEIRAALEAHSGNKSKSAEALGLSRQGLLKKLERYGLG